MHSDVRALAEALIARPSVTPDDAGCQDILASRLRPLGFDCECIDVGPGDFRVIRDIDPKRACRPCGRWSGRTA